MSAPSPALLELLRRSLKRFVREGWSQIEQGEPVGFDGGYLDTICDHEEACIRGDFTKLIINVVNRSLKSQITSVFLPAWIWLNDPSARILSAAWEEALALRDSRKTRELISTPWYQEIMHALLGDRAWKIVGDQNEKRYYENDAGGYRMATHVTGGTGRGGDVLIGDDLLGIDQSRSDVETEAAREWTLRTFMGRRNDPAKTRVVIAGHRLREDDPYGAILGKPGLGFVHVSLPLEYDPAEQRPPTPIGWQDPRTEHGESLCPERWGQAQIEEAKSLYEDLYEAIANQRPQKARHRPIKPEWIRRWTHLPVRMRVVQTWDTSFKGMDPTKPRTKRSRTAGLTFGFTDASAYLLDWDCRHMDFDEQSDAIYAMHERWPKTDTTWIEDEANGAALISALGVPAGGERDSKPGARKRLRRLIGSIPKGSKYLRLVAVSRFFRAGNVWFPPDDFAPWVPGFVKRLCDFPSVAFDDEIDALSQILKEEWLPDDDEARDAEDTFTAQARWD